LMLQVCRFAGRGLVIHAATSTSLGGEVTTLQGWSVGLLYG